MWRESSHSLHLLQIKHIEHVDTDMENSREGLVDERNILSRMIEDLVKEIQIGIRIKPKDRNIKKSKMYIWINFLFKGAFSTTCFYRDECAHCQQLYLQLEIEWMVLCRTEIPMLRKQISWNWTVVIAQTVIILAQSTLRLFSMGGWKASNILKSYRWELKKYNWRKSWNVSVP